MDWNVTKVMREMKDKARTQLASSGGGNHFVELGIVTPAEESLGLAAGEYVAVLSHSSSRDAGAAVWMIPYDIIQSKFTRSTSV